MVSFISLKWRNCGQSSCCGDPSRTTGWQMYKERGEMTAFQNLINSWLMRQDSIDFLNQAKQQQGRFTHERFRSANLDVPSVRWKSSLRSQIQNMKCKKRKYQMLSQSRSDESLMSHHLVEGGTSEGERDANLPAPRGDSNKTEPPLRKGDWQET